MHIDSNVHMRVRGVLAFSVGDIWFGARVQDVAGLIEAERLAPLPRQREPLAGVVAFRSTMVPTFDLAGFLGVDVSRRPGPRYALVLARGVDQFGVVIPSIPQLLPARDLVEAEVSTADSELASMLEAVYEAGGRRIHCLNYWSIIDSIMPSAGAPSSTAMGN